MSRAGKNEKNGGEVDGAPSLSALSAPAPKTSMTMEGKQEHEQEHEQEDEDEAIETARAAAQRGRKIREELEQLLLHALSREFSQPSQDHAQAGLAGGCSKVTDATTDTTTEANADADVDGDADGVDQAWHLLGPSPTLETEPTVDPEGAASFEQRLLQMLRAVAWRHARLSAQWLRVGYVQGNMNSDNALIGGRTMDYGPFGFMEVRFLVVDCL